MQCTLQVSAEHVQPNPDRFGSTPGHVENVGVGCGQRPVSTGRRSVTRLQPSARRGSGPASRDARGAAMRRAGGYTRSRAGNRHAAPETPTVEAPRDASDGQSSPADGQRLTLETQSPTVTSHPRTGEPRSSGALSSRPRVRPPARRAQRSARRAYNEGRDRRDDARYMWTVGNRELSTGMWRTAPTPTIDTRRAGLHRSRAACEG